MIRVAERLRSQLPIANALHTRADAASALVVVVGIAGALMGWSFLDLLAAALMGFMILRMGRTGLGRVKELIDTGLDETQVAEIGKTLRKTPGCWGFMNSGRGEWRTKRWLMRMCKLIHGSVFLEGHRIAELARANVLRDHPEVIDVLVHIDPQDDHDPDEAALVTTGARGCVARVDALLKTFLSHNGLFSTI